jgi:two-component sensor histidine kinase
MSFAPNAVKYGALSTPGGRIKITAEADETQNQFCLRWQEQGGPPVRPPTRQGFGTRLIRQSFVNQLHGRCACRSIPRVSSVKLMCR